MNSDDESFDPALARLFVTSHRALAAQEFVDEVLARVHLARRARLLRQTGVVLGVMILSGIAAPYAARGSLALAGWLGDPLPALGGALISPLGWVCSLLIAWKVMRRVLSPGP